MSRIFEMPRKWWPVVSSQFRLASNSQSSSSPWTGRQNVYGPHVQFWRASFSLPPRYDHEAAEFEGFMEQLGGNAGLLRMGYSHRRFPLWDFEVDPTIENFSDGTEFTDGTGFASGFLPPSVTTLEAAAFGDTSILIGGLPESTPRVLRRGDLFEVMRGGVWDETPSLHRIVRDAPTNADGETRIEFVPPLRKGVAPGDKVSLRWPCSVFRLADSEQGFLDRDAAGIATGAFSAVEAIG